MYHITIARKDSLSPVRVENVKHLWYDATVLKLSKGDNHPHEYEVWPWSQIDHLYVIEGS